MAHPMRGQPPPDLNTSNNQWLAAGVTQSWQYPMLVPLSIPPPNLRQPPPVPGNVFPPNMHLQPPPTYNSEHGNSTVGQNPRLPFYPPPNLARTNILPPGFVPSTPLSNTSFVMPPLNVPPPVMPRAPPPLMNPPPSINKLPAGKSWGSSESFRCPSKSSSPVKTNAIESKDPRIRKRESALLESKVNESLSLENSRDNSARNNEQKPNPVSIPATQYMQGVSFNYFNQCQMPVRNIQVCGLMHPNQPANSNLINCSNSVLGSHNFPSSKNSINLFENTITNSTESSVGYQMAYFTGVGDSKNDTNISYNYYGSRNTEATKNVQLFSKIVKKEVSDTTGLKTMYHEQSTHFNYSQSEHERRNLSSSRNNDSSNRSQSRNNSSRSSYDQYETKYGYNEQHRHKRSRSRSTSPECFKRRHIRSRSRSNSREPSRRRYARSRSRSNSREPARRHRSRSPHKERSRSRRSSPESNFQSNRNRPVLSANRNLSQDENSNDESDRKFNIRKERSKMAEDQPYLSTEPCKYVISSPSETCYIKVKEDSNEVIATNALLALHEKFKFELVSRASRVKALKPKYNPPIRKIKLRKSKPVVESSSGTSSSDNESSSEEENTAIEELEKKRQHPDRLHPELWFNDLKEMNDGPLCRCSAKARRSGIRHGIYVGEEPLPPCNPLSNNIDKLYHYKITMTPQTNFMTKTPTKIVHNGEKYIFEGFSMFSHLPLPKLPNCKVIRFNYEYTILYVEEPAPHNFTIAGLELFNKFLLVEILELVDLNWNAHNDLDGCPRFHFMPRFTRELEDNGKKFLSLDVIMEYLLQSNKILIDEKNLSEILNYPNEKWQNLADEVKGMIVTCPGMKPSSVRVDQLDREDCGNNKLDFPVIVHFGVRPPQLSYAGNPLYQKAWRDYVKYRHLLANKPKVRYEDRRKLLSKELKLQSMRMENDLKRDVTVVISSRGFYRTGIMSDVIQHAMLMPVLVCHLRFHNSLSYLEKKIGYKFKERFLLQLALTHPSYRENFGTNPDHARNSLTNCGLRQPQYGDRRIHYMNTRKRGINTLINIMSRFGSQTEATSCINHNERLEFLGDAVVEFLSSIHLFYMFPQLEEGGLATYRAAIVQNQHLAVLSKKLQLEKFMLYAHGSDLCHDLELRHAMANCFEALMGALFLDAGIEIADRVFSETLFPEPDLQEVWKNYPLHPLQEQEPGGDRKWIASVPLLQKLHEFEEKIGIEFTHIRLLARALTHRSLGYNNLTLGSNQRLEFLGDTVLQLVASEYLYKFFPQHHEGHLSLLRSSLVNNRTQAVVCADLGMVEYAIYPSSKIDIKSKDKSDDEDLVPEDNPVLREGLIKPKDKADFMEAFLGALYIDKDLGYCKQFCEVCFFPRLQDFIMNQDWNDPKSKLQQCCLTLRSMDGGEPDIPTYKVIECKGPTNTRVYSVAVYFQGNRLAVGTGHSIQQAEMDAASNALKKSKDLFPQLKHQKRAIERSLKNGRPAKPAYKSSYS